jgi:TRAP-type uncharacterized transport system substrate-binding protein
MGIQSMLDGCWRKFRVSLVGLGLATIVSGSPVGAETLRLFTIGAGDVSGGYYASAQAICEVINRAERGRLRCSPDPTQGSIYNLHALRKEQLDFAIVQSDWHRAAFESTGLLAAQDSLLRQHASRRRCANPQGRRAPLSIEQPRHDR